jgi:hypothetical protein
MTAIKHSNTNALSEENTQAPAALVPKIPQITEFLPKWLAEP